MKLLVVTEARDLLQGDQILVGPENPRSVLAVESYYDEQFAVWLSPSLPDDGDAPDFICDPRQLLVVLREV